MHIFNSTILSNLIKHFFSGKCWKSNINHFAILMSIAMKVVIYDETKNKMNYILQDRLGI